MAILVIDDDYANRTMFARALRDVAEVDTASGGEEAITKLAERLYDCVLLDAHMPGVDGMAVLEALSLDGGLNRAAPVYVITADSSPTLRDQVIARGAACVITKPVQIAMLVSFVKTTLRTGRASASITAARRPPPQDPD